jgi:HEAT repeat protein
MDQRAREVVALLRLLWYGLSAYRLYPGALERPGFRAAVERIARAAEPVLAAGIVDLRIGPDGFATPGGEPLPPDEDALRLARACFERGAERLTISAPPDASDLAAFFDVLATPPAAVEEAGGLEAALGEGRAVRLSPVGPEPVLGADRVVGDRSPAVPPERPATDLLVEDLRGSEREQAETILERLRAFAAQAPEEAPRDPDFHRRLYDAVADLPRPLRLAVNEILIDRVGDDPFAQRLIGTLNNAELSRVLVDLGREGRDPMELARHLAAVGVRPTDVVDLTAALQAGHEDAGTIIAGLERLGLELGEPPGQAVAGGSLADVMARYLVATEQDDLRAIGGMAGDEEARAAALRVAEDYVALEEDVVRLRQVLEVWGEAVRRALTLGRREELAALVRVADRARARGPEHAAELRAAVRRALDPGTVAELTAAPDAIALLAPLGAGAVEALLDALAEEADRGRRALLVGLLGKLAAAHPGPVLDRLSDERWYVVRNAVSILARVGSPVALDRLAAVAHHPQPAVRREVAAALVAIGGAGAIRILRDLATDPEEEVRARAVDSLGALTDPGAAAILAEVARTDPSAALRRRAVEALGAHPAPGATALLMELASRRSRPRLRRGLRRLAASLARERGGAG